MILKEHDKDLTEVINILKEMFDELDGTLYTCNNCGRDSWKDLKEGRIASEVGAMLRKGRKCQLLIRESFSDKEVAQ